MLMDDNDDFVDYADSDCSEDEDLAEAYCEAKDKKPSGTDGAVDAFEFVLTLEQRDAQRTKWGFKALKQLLKLEAAKGSTEVLRNYERILAYHSAVTDSQMEKACLKALTFLVDVDSFREFGQITNEALRDAKPMLWSRIAMRLATMLFDGGRDEDGLLILADLTTTVQHNARLAAFADSLLLDVYKLEAEIRIGKGDFEQIAALHAAAESRQWAENTAAMAVINECFGVALILKSQYALADQQLVAAADIHADERSKHALRCSQLLAMSATLQAGPDNYASALLSLPQPTDSRVLAASELARLYETEHGDAFLTETQNFLAEDTDPLVACVLEQWATKVRKAQAEMKHCLDYPLDGRLARNEVFQSDRFARLRKQFTAEPDEYIRKLCVTRAFAAELQYWLRLGEDRRVRGVLNNALTWCIASDVHDSSASLLREFSGRSFFELGSLNFAQRNLLASLRHCSAERVQGCTQLLVLVDLLLGEDDDVIEEILEEATLNVLRQLAKHICTFEPAECARLLADADYLARLDPFIVKTLQEWIATMTPVKECLRDVEPHQMLGQRDRTATMQRVEDLKQKANDESNAIVKHMCRMQLDAAELQLAYATGDLERLRDVLHETRLNAERLDDRTSAAGIIHEFQGRLHLIDAKVSDALSAFLLAEHTYASCGSQRLAACKQHVLFCRLVQHAAGGHEFPSTESADEALLELMVPLTAAFAKADFGVIHSILDGLSFAELSKNGLFDAVPQWLKNLEDSNHILTQEGQALADASDYITLRRALDGVRIPSQIFDMLTREIWRVRLWSLEVQLGYHSINNRRVDRFVEHLEELSVSVQHSEPAGIVWEFSAKRYLRSNDRPRALERFQQALQIFEINGSDRRHARARYIALTLRPNQPLTDHLGEQYATTAEVVAVRDLMGAYYADERERFYELLRNAEALLMDAFIAERLQAHCETLKARICLRPIQLPTESWEVVLSMLKDEGAAVQITSKKFRETFTNVFNMPRK